VLDALNHRSTISYNANGNVQTVTDALGRRTTTTYDDGGNVLTQTDHLGNTTSYAYDALNRQTAVTEAVGTSVQRTSTQAYDAVGNVTSSTDALGNVATSVYDALNRETVSIDPLGHRVTTTYDAVGDQITRTDPLGKVTTYSYDVRHRQVAATDPLGHITTTVLDAVGNAVASIDALGHMSKTILDNAERTVGTVDALGRVTTLTLSVYPALHQGVTRAVTDPDGNTTTYARDGLYRETSSTSPVGTVTTTSYDAVGNVTKVTDRNGRVDNYSYDAANRLTGEVWKNTAGTTVNVVTYGYDANDNRTSAADSSGTLTATYDALNRATGTTDVLGLRLTYTYNALDQAYQRSDSLGGLLTSVYDAAGRLTSKQFQGTGLTWTAVRVDFGYNARDDMTSKTWYSNIAGTTVVATSTYGIDDAGRVTAITNKDGSSTTLSYYNYSYDAADRVTTQTYWSKVGTTTYSGTKNYSYDATNQLLGDGTSNYSFDKNGNRTMSGYQTAGNNLMTSDGTYSYVYDNSGNTIEKTKGTGHETWYYGYDNRNRLTLIRDTSDGSTNILTDYFTYDIDDRLVQQQKWVTGGSTVTTRYAYDGQNVWADLDGSNNLLVRYVCGDGMDQVLTRTVASGTSVGVWAYFTDNQGSVRDLSNWVGVVLDHLDYSGFGVIVTEANAAYGDRIKYTARWYDADTGLQNNRARWYEVSAGRWLSEDPEGFGAGDVNLDRYVGNRSTNAVDPTGLITSELPHDYLPPKVLAYYQQFYEEIQDGMHQEWLPYYPPTFEKKGHNRVAFITDQSAVPNDGFLWIPKENHHSVKGMDDIRRILISKDDHGKDIYPDGSLDMILISGHSTGLYNGLFVRGSKFPEVELHVRPGTRPSKLHGLTAENLNLQLAKLIGRKLKPNGLVVFASCEGGLYRKDLALLAEKINRTVAAPKGICKGGPFPLTFEQRFWRVSSVFDPSRLGGYSVWDRSWKYEVVHPPSK
jgi:RHS repeat-associated protein